MAAINWHDRDQLRMDPKRPHIRRGIGVATCMHGTAIAGLEIGLGFRASWSFLGCGCLDRRVAIRDDRLQFLKVGKNLAAQIDAGRERT